MIADTHEYEVGYSTGWKIAAAGMSYEDFKGQPWYEPMELMSESWIAGYQQAADDHAKMQKAIELGGRSTEEQIMARREAVGA